MNPQNAHLILVIYLISSYLFHCISYIEKMRPYYVIECFYSNQPATVFCFYSNQPDTVFSLTGTRQHLKMPEGSKSTPNSLKK